MNQSGSRGPLPLIISPAKRKELRKMLWFTANTLPEGPDRKKVIAEGRRLIRVAYGTPIHMLRADNFVDAYAKLRAYCETLLDSPLPEYVCVRDIAADTQGLLRLMCLKGRNAVQSSGRQHEERKSGSATKLSGVVEGAPVPSPSPAPARPIKTLEEFLLERYEQAATADPTEACEPKPRPRALTKEERIASAAALVEERMLKAKLRREKAELRRTSNEIARKRRAADDREKLRASLQSLFNTKKQ